MIGVVGALIGNGWRGCCIYRASAYSGRYTHIELVWATLGSILLVGLLSALRTPLDCR